MLLFFSDVLHICPFYRGIYLQYVEYSGICMLFVFFFVMFYIMFHFIEA